MKSFVRFALILLSFNLVTTIMASSFRGMRVGGITDDEKPANEDVQNILTSLSSEIKTAAVEASAGTDGVTRETLEDHFKTAALIPLGHKTQLVAGTNYFVRTKIGDYIFHVRIYRDLKKNVSLAKVIGPKKEADPIEYF